MKNVKTNSGKLEELSNLELVHINGGYAEYEEGHAAGAYVRKIIDGVLTLKWIFL